MACQGIGLAVKSAQAETIDKKIEFRADHYIRDAGSDSILGRGNAWTRRGDREIHADEIQVEFKNDQIVASGNVRISEGRVEIHCSNATFSLSGQQAHFDNARMGIGQIVISGKTITKLDSKTFEVENGTYSNCNVEGLGLDQASQCPLDWRMSGTRFRIEVGRYGHLYDVLIQAKDVPIFYTPYLLMPLKSGRQTGILPIVLSNSSSLGSGISIPIFFALSEWQDMTTEFTQFSKVGPHVVLRYRYVYSPRLKGSFNAYFINQKFGSNDDDPTQMNPGDKKLFGFIGEKSVNMQNYYTFEDNRTQTRQVINLVSHPFYTYNYALDVSPKADLGYIRSMFSLSHPRDEWFLGTQIQHFQPLVVSKDSGVDRGAVTQLPHITAAKTNTLLGTDWLSYEIDTQFNNYYRLQGFDEVPTAPKQSGAQSDSVTGYDSNDYIRTGQRIQLEPRLVLSAPMPYGFLLQPVLTSGVLLYHFSLPSSGYVKRYYLQTEIPFSFQVQKMFSTSYRDFRKVQHVLQPRVILASNLYPTPVPDHPFFQKTNTDYSNPPFDQWDTLPNFQYLRFELINRLRALSDAGWRRFFLLQLSEQLNLRRDESDPRFKQKLGPIELLGSLYMGRFGLQFQSLFPLELTHTLNGAPITPVREVTFGTGLTYDAPGSDSVRLNLNLYTKADTNLINHALYLYWYKTLPFFFDFDINAEYDFYRKLFRGYGIGFHFRRKPKSCWNVSLTINRNVYAQTIIQAGFGFDFGHVSP